MPNKVDIKVEANADVSDLDKAQRELHKLEQGADKASKKGLSLGEAFSASVLGNLGADIIANASGKLVQLGSDVINLADQLVDLAGKSGTTVEGFQSVANAAADNGSSLTEVADVFSKISLNAAKAIDGNKDLSQAFSDLGVTVTDLRTLTPDELFLKISDAVKSTNDRGTTYANVAKTMGEQSKNLFTTLEQGRVQILETSKAFGVMSDATAKDLDKALQEIDKFKKKSTIAFGEILAKSREFWNALTDNDALTAGFEGMLGLTREQQNEFRKMSRLGKKDAEEIVQGIDGIEKKTKQLIDTTNQYKLPDVPKTEASPTTKPEQKAPAGPKPLGQNTAEIDARLGQKTAEIDSKLGQNTAEIDSKLGELTQKIDGDFGDLKESVGDSINKVGEATGDVKEALNNQLTNVSGKVDELAKGLPDQFKAVNDGLKTLGGNIEEGLTGLVNTIKTVTDDLNRRVGILESQIKKR